MLVLRFCVNDPYLPFGNKPPQKVVSTIGTPSNSKYSLHSASNSDCVHPLSCRVLCRACEITEPSFTAILKATYLFLKSIALHAFGSYRTRSQLHPNSPLNLPKQTPRIHRCLGVDNVGKYQSTPLLRCKVTPHRLMMFFIVRSFGAQEYLATALTAS